MRITLIAALFMAGCLHAQATVANVAKADPELIRTFDALINEADTIEIAEMFAKAKGLRREDWIGSADRAYWSFMKARVYVPAAEIARRFHFGKSAIDMPLQFQRGDVDKAVAAYAARRTEGNYSDRLYAAIGKMTLEIRLVCRYGPTSEAAKETVVRAVDLKRLSEENDVLYPLLDEGCPVGPALRTAIIDAASDEGKYSYAIRHGAEADWDWIKTSQFLWELFLRGNCTAGIEALVAFKVPIEQAVGIVEGSSSSCESEILDSRDWNLDHEAANAFFFAAVRGRKFNLALEILPFGTLGENGQVFLFQEAMRGGKGGIFMQAIKLHPVYHDAFMAFLWDKGRYRFIMSFSLTPEWERRAFDKLIELGQWDFAAEGAQYGVSESFRTEGILLAFRAAMAAGDFKAGRYFLARYGPTKTSDGLVTQEMYDEEYEKWYATRKAMLPVPVPSPESAQKARRKRPKPVRRACPDDDWCP